MEACQDGSYQRIYIPGVSPEAVIVEPVAHNEIVGNLHAAVFDVQFHLELAWFQQERTNADACWILLLERLQSMRHGKACVYDVLDYYYMSPCNVNIKAYQFTDGTRGGNALIRSEFHKRYLAWNGHFPQQVGSENEGAVEHGKEYRALVPVVLVD